MRQALFKWASWKLDAHVYYMGSKLPSRRSNSIYSLYRMVRRGHRAVTRVFGEKNLISKPFAGLRDHLLCWHHLSLAQDRYQRYEAGMKKAMAGSLVIFDRYPLEVLNPQLGPGYMDGSKIATLIGRNAGGIARRMARAERALYEKMRPPEYLAILNVSPEVSLQRKPDHKQDVVEAKSLLVSDLMALADSDPKRLRSIPLNADLPFEEVFLQLKRRIWDIL